MKSVLTVEELEPFLTDPGVLVAFRKRAASRNWGPAPDVAPWPSVAATQHSAYGEPPFDCGVVTHTWLGPTARNVGLLPLPLNTKVRVCAGVSLADAVMPKV